MRKYVLLFGYLIFVVIGFAQDAKVSLKASKTEVITGEQFNIVLSSDVNGNGDLSLPKDFQVVSRMSGSSSRFINGQQSFEVSKTYTVISTRKGEYTIPGAAWNYGNGKTVKSNSIKIRVVEGTAPQQQQQQYYDPFGNLFGTPRQQQIQQPVEEKHFGMLITSKKVVYVGEPVVLSGKVYFDGHIVDVGDFQPYKMNLMAHKTDLRPDKVNLSVSREEYGGKSYQTIPLFEDLIIPQQAGVYTFSPFNINIGFQRGFFEQGFKLVKSNETTISVIPLPNGAPVGFKGAVGNYTAKINYDVKPSMQVGDIIGVRVSIEGNGNINLLKALELNLPDGIVLYGDPKVENNVKVSRNGAQGTINYEFVAQIEKGGKYSFKPFEFAFFNPETKRYQNVNVPKLHFEASGEISSDTEALDVKKSNTIEQASFQIWKTITLSLLGLFLLFALYYFLKKNSDFFIVKPKMRSINAQVMTQKSLEAINPQDSQTLDQVEKIILQFFKDYTQNQQLLISEQWFENEAQKLGVAPTVIQQWREHFGAIQAMKYANFGQQTNEALIEETKKLVRLTKV
jgi:hypothetical protein